MNNKIDVSGKIDNPSALTQEQGDIIYNEIVSSFEKKQTIILDFANVESMISPFLNNAIGQLYKKYTTDYITKYLKLENFPANKNATLNIVIANAKRYYNDKVPFRPNVSNEEPTTQCKELAKIAGTCGCSPHVVSFGRYPKILG